MREDPLDEAARDEAANDEASYGVAALTLLEAVILTLRERQVISEDELDDAFAAAIGAHRNSADAGGSGLNRSAARILERLRTEGNSVRLES